MTRDILEVVFEVNDTGELVVMIATHWPSRSKSRSRSEQLRIALAENIAFSDPHERARCAATARRRHAPA